MPFRYRMQKMLDFRIRKKEEQLQEVIKAKNEVDRIQGLIDDNNLEIAGVIQIMRTTVDFKMIEKEKLAQCEKEVKVLEKHKERALEQYKAEEKAAEIKQLSEVAVQKYFQRSREKKEEEAIENGEQDLNGLYGTIFI